MHKQHTTQRREKRGIEMFEVVLFENFKVNGINNTIDPGSWKNSKKNACQ